VVEALHLVVVEAVTTVTARGVVKQQPIIIIIIIQHLPVVAVV
jgi:hypothetical protein